MIEIALQYRNGIYAPATLAEQDKAAAAHKPNQIIRGKLTECRSARSLRQLRLYWGSCNTVAENAFDPKLSSKEAVDWHTRVQLRFVDPDRVAVIGEKIIIQVRSIAFDQLTYLDMNTFMERALTVHAGWLGVNRNELVKELQRKGYG
ncbi:hypothetical protein [Desulfoluna spongiiphila]|uniref:hypothetical protein n=1 Tax=Desulfoluna spongiiphila TaxID=419481 RepID=UPI00125B4D3B|nr:hypothetical protein [Desulfoluna spongiiphila]VVS95337.1 hypothetical protein DBB_49140 [Desulfoluna spongiiphila]